MLIGEARRCRYLFHHLQGQISWAAALPVAYDYMMFCVCES